MFQCATSAWFRVLGGRPCFRAFGKARREGQRWWNHFENQASEEGLFGGIVNGSVCPEMMARVLGGGRPAA